MDPKAEKYYMDSPYAYCSSNPIIHIGIDGREKVKALNPNIQYNSRLINAANNYKDDGAIHVWAHGSPNSITVYNGKNDVTISSTKDFQKFLSAESKTWQTKGKDEQVTIVLHSCETGKESDGNSSFARQLSKDLKNTTIIAPTENVVVDNNNKELGSYSTKTVNEGGKEKTVIDKQGRRVEFENGKITDGHSGDWQPHEPLSNKLSNTSLSTIVSVILTSLIQL
jgi:hypothetical protein